jgi:hypothetical protein
LRFQQKFAALLPFQQGQQGRQRRAYIANEAKFYRIPQPNVITLRATVSTLCMKLHNRWP